MQRTGQPDPDGGGQQGDVERIRGVDDDEFVGAKDDEESRKDHLDWESGTGGTDFEAAGSPFRNCIGLLREQSRNFLPLCGFGGLRFSILGRNPVVRHLAVIWELCHGSNIIASHCDSRSVFPIDDSERLAASQDEP